MTPSSLFAPPPPRNGLPWMTVLVLTVSLVLGGAMMDRFVDALHLSMTRGEALRAMHRMPVATEAAPDRQEGGDRLHLAQAVR